MRWYRAKWAGQKAILDGKLPSDNPYKVTENGNHSWWKADHGRGKDS
jgi:hypothetical protein